MDFRTCLFAVTLALAAASAAAPALAAPVLLPACESKGGETAAMAFPKGDASDLTLARSVLPAVALGFEAKFAMPACSRGRAQTEAGELVLGGEDDDAPFARTAYRADGQPGAFAFVAKTPGDASPTPTYVLVFARPEGILSAHRLYAGLPSDAALLADLAAAAGEARFILAQRRMPGAGSGPATQVSYGFPPPPGGPPAQQSGDQTNGTHLDAGPQFMVGDGSQAFLDLTVRSGEVTHRASGRACPQVLAGGAVLLQQVDATAADMNCSYREGPSLTLDTEAHAKYRLMVFKDRETVAALMKDLAASGRKALPVKADRAPPLATGPAPLPQAAQFWTLKDGSVQGIWLGKSGDWIIRLQVDYPDAAANDAEAKAIAEGLFRELNPAASRR